MRQTLFLAVLLAFVPMTGPLVAESSGSDSKPNFVFINIDDLGYADIGAFGSTINQTPNIDRMAMEGRKLTSFYAAPVCSPSRASLMTGCYPKRTLPITHVLFPAGEVGLNPEEKTVAEVLKDAGYRTACIGKWHLGDQPDFLPTAQGFDYYLGIPYSNDMGTVEDGSKSDLGAPLPNKRTGDAVNRDELGLRGLSQPPLPLVENTQVIGRVKQDEQQAIVETYTAAAVKFIREHADQPFFLYLPHSAVHFPLYPGKSWAGKSSHGLYSDWVEEVDWSVGQVLDALREAGVDQKTLVIFTSDNGGTARGSNKPLRGFKGSTWEGGIRVPTIARWPGKIPAGTSTSEITGMHDILPTFASLAGASASSGRKLDGLDISGVLQGDPDAKGHSDFYYYRGLELQAVRSGPWKLHFGTPANANQGRAASQRNANARAVGFQLYHLGNDLAESQDVAESNPDVVARLKAMADEMNNDLGTSELGPGVRPLGRFADPQPMIDQDGRVRANALGTHERFP